MGPLTRRGRWREPSGATTRHTRVDVSTRVRRTAAPLAALGVLLGGAAACTTRAEAPPVPPAAGEATVPVRAEPTGAVPTAARCEARDPLAAAPPLPDEARQRRVVARLDALSAVEVRHAAPTALGVVALVVDRSGDLDLRVDPDVRARLRAAGVAHAYEWDPSARSVGVDAAGQVARAVQWVLVPVAHRVRVATSGLRGGAGLAYWQAGGAIHLSWAAPVPRAVRALAGERPGGAGVVVREVRYSQADVRRAYRRLAHWLRETGRREAWSTAGACPDGSGLVVGMRPSAAREPGLADALAAAVGMPVEVVAARRPASLLPGAR